MNSPRPVPVTVLTGFLGSGKTTLLNRILTEQHGKKIAVIENEFGEIGIDNELVIRAEEEVFEMNNGCICCSVRGDLLRILGRLMRRKKQLDAVLIETTGLADPGPVTQTFFADAELRSAYQLDAIVTVVDAKHVLQHLDTDAECLKQIGFADIVLLNKIDLVTTEELDALEAKLRGINSFAQYYRTKDAAVDLEKILDVGAFDLNRKLEYDPNLLDESAHIHNNEVGSVGLRFDKPLDTKKLDVWLGTLLRTRGPDIYRLKGILNVAGNPRRMVFQGVHMQMEGRQGEPWGAAEPRESKIVFIGKNLNRNELRAGLEGCVAEPVAVA
ncbi:cobalamin biosynthesis protein CobW [Verrucomicrobia bacterium LW23]|nr:cobalamin biosynthesis protein CobW [Verrucomicrobia bacterium LW23]